MFFLYSKCYAKCFFRLLLKSSFSSRIAPIVSKFMRFSRASTPLLVVNTRLTLKWKKILIVDLLNVWRTDTRWVEFNVKHNALERLNRRHRSEMWALDKWKSRLNFSSLYFFHWFFLEHTYRLNRARCDQRRDWPTGFSREMKVRLDI